MADNDKAFTALLKDDSCPSSSMYASVHNHEMYSTPGPRGVSREHFERIHGWLSASQWTEVSQWQQKVSYMTRAHFTDTCQENVFVSYNGADPMQVSCTREYTVGQPLYFECQSKASEKIIVVVKRSRTTDCRPPEHKSRYSCVMIQNVREFVRISSSFKNVSFQYKMTVQWSGPCLRDAYAAKPTYLMDVKADVTEKELTDNSMLPLTTMTASFLHDPSKVDWLHNNFKAKIMDICMTRQLMPCVQPVIEMPRMSKNNKGKKVGQIEYEPEDDGALLEETEAGEFAECYDNADDEAGDDNYL